MNKDSNIPEKSAKYLFQKGDDPRRNLKGRPIGTRDFATDFDEVVEELAKEEGITKSAARKELLKVAYKNAKGGNYSFYKDIHDRVYGQATQKTEHMGNVTVNFDSSFIHSNDAPSSSPETNSQ